jgi:hypothetical protein
MCVYQLYRASKAIRDIGIVLLVSVTAMEDTMVRQPGA